MVEYSEPIRDHSSKKEKPGAVGRSYKSYERGSAPNDSL